MTCQDIRDIINRLPFIKEETPFVLDDQGCLTGEVGILAEGMPTSLRFQTTISPSYPFKTNGREPIEFCNPDLIEYPHIMERGNLCLHTSYWTDPLERLESDFNQLLSWVKKYYIYKETDPHYEHLVVNASAIDNQIYSIHFTQPSAPIIAGEFGIATIADFRNSLYKGFTTKNLLLCSITKLNTGIKQEKPCSWSSTYLNLPARICPYLILASIPGKHNKFAFSDYTELSTYLSSEQKGFLHFFESQQYKKRRGEIVPILFGYRIPTGETHWLASLSRIGEFPIEGIAEIKNGVKTGKWTTEFKNESIIWGLTYDASYDLFFGRGAFDKSFTSKKILIIGIGAIGSIIARTLARCGCKDMTVYDYDIKKPENICRSEYDFISGVGDKVAELLNQLSAINPHLNINSLPVIFDNEIKLHAITPSAEDKVEEVLNSFDIIFDCSTDDDLMNILEGMSLNAKVVNISISNHASELVCAFSPTISRFVHTSFNTIINNDTSDLFEPSGCWNPTFKASYNDIALMAQYAIRHIYRMLNGDSPTQNFILRDTESGLKIIKY